MNYLKKFLLLFGLIFLATIAWRPEVSLINNLSWALGFSINPIVIGIFFGFDWLYRRTFNAVEIQKKTE